jgi:hypothetical protein
VVVGPHIHVVEDWTTVLEPHLILGEFGNIVRSEDISAYISSMFAGDGRLVAEPACHLVFVRGPLTSTNFLPQSNPRTFVYTNSSLYCTGDPCANVSNFVLFCGGHDISASTDLCPNPIRASRWQISCGLNLGSASRSALASGNKRRKSSSYLDMRTKLKTAM